MAVDQASAVQRQIRIEAQPETVFEFFTDPDKMVRWKGRSAELDPRPGGTYRVDINGRDIALGEYVELVPYSRVVFTWGWEADGNPVPPGSSTVEVTLEPDGDGTLVRLTHSGLPEEARPPHGHGWEHYLERLSIAATGGDAGHDSFADPPSEQ